MNTIVKQLVVSATLVAMIALLSACGEEKEDNIPAVKLIASAVVSDIQSGHGHNVVIPFTDISATPAALFQYRSSDNTGHSHVIALSDQQMIDLNNGMRLTVTSSAQSSGTAHTHTWNIVGGTVLYDKYCYNCHTNDKRGHTPMNVTFTASQTSAVINPNGATLSVSPAAIPDPLFTPAAETSLDGAFLYSTYCAACHGPLASSTKANRSATQIKQAMGNMGLSDAQLQAIATALIR